MNRTTWILSALATFLLLLVPVLMFTFNDEPVETTDLWSNKLQVRLELREGEIRRIVEYYPDLVTPHHSVADLVNGQQKEFFYRPDGTLERANTYSAESNGSRSVLRIAVLDSDGQTYLEDKQFFESGNLKRLVLLEDPDTTSQRSYFDQNGWNLAQSKTISRANEDRLWTVIAETTYRPNATKSHSFAATETVETTTHFDEQENPTAIYVFDKKQDVYTEREFAEDGETLVRNVLQNDDGTFLELNREDGTLAEKREWFGEIGNSGMHVHLFDEKGRKTRSQWWLWLADQVELRQIELFDPVNDYRTRMMLLYTDGPGKGKVEYELEYHTPDESNGLHTYRQYYPDGSLQFEKVFSGDGKTLSDKSFTEEDQVFVEFDPSWFEVQEIKTPPYKVVYIPDDQ